MKLFHDIGSRNKAIKYSGWAEISLVIVLLGGALLWATVTVFEIIAPVNPEFEEIMQND